MFTIKIIQFVSFRIIFLKIIMKLDNHNKLTDALGDDHIETSADNPTAIKTRFAFM